MTRILLLLSLFLFDTSITPINYSTSSSSTFGEVAYLLRVVESSTIGPSNESLTIESGWRRRGIEQVYSAKFKIIRTFELQNVLIRFERCRDLEIACEDFQTWNITPVLFCEWVKMKNQPWSPIWNSINPKPVLQNCPRPQIKQGTYTMENVTIETDAVVKFYHQAVTYHWKVHSMFYNMKNGN